MALGGFDELISAGANALGYPDPFALSGSAQGGTSIEISQEEGDPAQRITVVLRGRAMPYRQVAWEVEQRSKITWYPGNPVATQQVLGPEELPTVMGGMWKDRFIKGDVVKNGNPDEIDTAEKAVRLFHDLARSGKRVRVQWLSEVRSGIIKRFVPVYDRAQDVRWELEFEWQSRNDEVAPRAAVDPGNAVDLLSFLDRVENIAALVPLAAELLTGNVAAVIDSIERVREVASDLFQVLRIAETLVNLPATLLGAVKSALGRLERELSELIRRVTGPRSSGLDQSSATQLKGSTTDPRSQQKSAGPRSGSDAQELRFEVWRRSLALALSNLLFAAQTQSAATLRRAQPQTTQVVTVREGEDLYSLSARFFGSPDFANYLAAANRLTTATIPPGTELRIPPRPIGGSASVDAVYSPQLPCDARCEC